jgi:hypothetical protein
MTPERVSPPWSPFLKLYNGHDIAAKNLGQRPSLVRTRLFAGGRWIRTIVPDEISDRFKARLLSPS